MEKQECNAPCCPQLRGASQAREKYFRSQRTFCWLDNCVNVNEKVTSVRFSMKLGPVVPPRKERAHSTALKILPGGLIECVRGDRMPQDPRCGTQPLKVSLNPSSFSKKHTLQRFGELQHGSHSVGKSASYLLSKE